VAGARCGPAGATVTGRRPARVLVARVVSAVPGAGQAVRASFAVQDGMRGAGAAWPGTGVTGTERSFWGWNRWREAGAAAASAVWVAERESSRASAVVRISQILAVVLRLPVIPKFRTNPVPRVT